MRSEQFPQIPGISIVVPTFQRPVHLKRLLDALIEQTVIADIFEIIVVDNEINSNTEVQALCASREYQALDLNYFHHPNTGVSSARNLGVSQARASLIGFLDDDTLPSKDWIRLVFATQDKMQAGIIGGPYKPFYTSTPPKWFRDSYASLDYGEQARWLGRHEYLACANMACNRGFFQQLGGFSEGFGYIGTKKRYGEDTEWQQRAVLAGHRIWYDPALRIQHHVEAERMPVGWMLASMVRHGRVKASLLIIEPGILDQRPVFRQVLTLLKKYLLGLFRLCKAGLLVLFRNKQQYPYLQNYLVEVVGREIRQISLCSGLIRLTLKPGIRGQGNP